MFYHVSTPIRWLSSLMTWKRSRRSGISSGEGSTSKTVYTFTLRPLPDSIRTCELHASFTNLNPNVTIELSSHCDFRGTDSYNQRLSQARAESVVEYLIDNGIEKERLTAVGYGEGKPKEVSKKMTETYTFLKEGDILSEEFINTLEDEQQKETCHQLNRRTEFQVLRTTYKLYE